MRDDMRVTLVSNRGPVSFVRSGAGFQVTRGAGGLSGAVDPVCRRLGDRALWICAATTDDERAAVADGQPELLEEELGYPVRMIDIEPETYARYYDEVSNRMLWFANHCLWDEIGLPEFPPTGAFGDAYEPTNEMFAAAAAEATDEAAVVLFQDYHLATAPRHLRERHPHQISLHFTHSSFCGPEGMSHIPKPVADRVIDGMLGADLVGFHVDAWCRGFMECCRQLGAEVNTSDGWVEHRGHRSWVRSYPIPVDPAELLERAAAPEVDRWVGRFRDKVGARRVIARADRMEPSKNIVRGFEAFGALLDEHADLRDSVCFIACIYPSRQSMEEYRRYAVAVEEAAADIEKRYPGSVLFFSEDDFDRTLAAYRIYDVLLVNPLMDGMNLVAKEGPLLNNNDGTLVLSTGAGAFQELGELAHAIDPLDVGGTAAALFTALSMSPDERSTRARALRNVVSARTPAHWIEPQLDDLAALQDKGDPLTPPPHVAPDR